MKAITRFLWIVAATVVCVLPVTAQNPAGDVASESDFYFAVRQIEAYYAGYPSLVTDTNGVTLWIPISRSCGLPEQAIDGTGIEPDVKDHPAAPGQPDR